MTDHIAVGPHPWVSDAIWRFGFAEPDAAWSGSEFVPSPELVTELVRRIRALHADSVRLADLLQEFWRGRDSMDTAHDVAAALDAHLTLIRELIESPMSGLGGESVRLGWLVVLPDDPQPLSWDGDLHRTRDEGAHALEQCRAAGYSPAVLAEVVLGRDGAV